MKKENFITLMIGTVGMVLFALGMCMCLIEEWNSFNQGIVMGIASIMLFFGIRMLLNRKPYRRKMREKIESERIRKEEEEREKREREKMIADSIFQERIIYAQIQEIEAQERLEYLRAEARKKLEQQRIEQEKAAEEKRKWRAERDVSRVDGMEGHEFEYFCADLLTRNGFSDISVTRGSGDQGVDILARKEGIKYAIQCKNYASKLGNTPVQEVNTGKIFYNCHIGIVLTNSTFTPSAQQLADSTGVLLWDREKLQQLMLDAK